jgi:hypothetical protein
MRRIIIGLVLLGTACGSAQHCDCGDEWEKRSAVVGTGTRQALVTTRHDSIAESRLADLRALFTPDLLAIYQVDAAVHSGAAPEWRVGVDTVGGSHVFAFQGRPPDPRTVQMLETLDTFTRSLLLD